MSPDLILWLSLVAALAKTAIGICSLFTRKRLIRDRPCMAQRGTTKKCLLSYLVAPRDRYVFHNAHRQRHYQLTTGNSTVIFRGGRVRHIDKRQFVSTRQFTFSRQPSIMSYLLFPCTGAGPWSCECCRTLVKSNSIVEDDDTAAAVQVGSQTPLFVAIKEHKWEQVLTYLRSGQWPAPQNAEEVPPPQGDQCKQWVVDDAGLTRLPLHTAIVEEAPAIVLQRILGLYPAAIQARDSAHLLPIQLAVTVATSDQALFTLLDAWPPGIVVPPRCRETRDDRPDEQILHRRRQNISWSNSTRKHYRNLLLLQIKYAIQSKHPSDVWKQVLGNLELDLDCHDHINTIIAILMMHRNQKLRQKSQRQTSRTMEQNVPKSLWQAPVEVAAARSTPSSAPEEKTKDTHHRGRGRGRRRCRSVLATSKE